MGNANARPPSKVTTHPKGQAPGVKAPTSKTSFGTTYKSKVTVNGHRTTHVYVYHDRSYYGSASWLALDIALRRADPYYYGNYYDPYSPWFGHPVMIAAQCQNRGPEPPPNEHPDQAPVNVVVNEQPTTTTTAPPISETTTSTSTMVAPSTTVP